MDNTENIKLNKPDRKKLPKALQIYENADFALQQKARFLFYLSIVIIVCIVILLFISEYVQIAGTYEGKFNFQVILPELICFFLVFSCLVLIVKGFFLFAVHLLLISILSTIWSLMWQNIGEPITRLDNFALIICTLFMLPLLIERKLIILVYLIVNMGLLVLFVIVFKQELLLSHSSAIEYLADNIIGLLFFGVVAYNIFGIHKNTLQKALTETNERYIAETALVQSEKKFIEMTNLLPQTIFEADKSGKLGFVNKNGLDLFGFTLEDLKNGMYIHTLIVETDQQKVRENIIQLYKGELTTGNHYTAIKKDGSTFPVQIFSGVLAEDNQIKGIRGILFDNSERKRAEDLIRTNEARLLKAQILGRFGYSEQILNSTTVWASAEAMRIFGFGTSEGVVTSEQIGVCIDDILPFRENYLELVNKGKRFDMDFAINPADNSPQRYIHAISEIEKDEKGKPFKIISTFQDVTEKVKIEHELAQHRDHLELLIKKRTEELEAANEELTSTNEELYDQRRELEKALDNLKVAQTKLIQSEKMASLGVLAAGIAHEINNPLNFINGGIEGIESYFTENLNNHLEEVEPLINAIQVGVKRAADIVSSLNHYGRRNDSAVIKCNVQLIIDNCLIMLNNQIKNRIGIIKNYTYLPYTLLANEGRLHQVFLNILANATQAIENEGTISILTQINNDRMVISITDTGCGISEEVLPRITDPFFTTKDPGKGTGLGLSISYNILNEISGTLSFESKLGKGTKAVISIPLNQN